MGVIDGVRAIQKHQGNLPSKVLLEAREKVGNIGELASLTPTPMYEKIDNPRSPFSLFDDELVNAFSFLWELSSVENSDMTSRYAMDLDFHGEYLSPLIGKPNNSFVKTTFNRRAWIRNEVYRSNVNFEGYAFWNASVFYTVAMYMMNMKEEDINLVLRIIPFNETIALRAMFAPQGIDLVGPGHHTSLLSPERYREMVIGFCSELQHVIISHRQRTKRRYSNRDVSGLNLDPETTEIVEQVRRVFDKYRKDSKRIASKKG